MDDTNTTAPSAREVIHQNEDVCQYMLKSVVTTFSLAIQASRIASPGSGLFVSGNDTIDQGHEIFRMRPMITCVDSSKESVCHYCFTDASSVIHPSGRLRDSSDGEVVLPKACMGCKVARFCSKDCQKKAWSLFHRDECKVLKETPTLSGKTLALHRLLFWQDRNFIEDNRGKAIKCLDTHFRDYMDDDDQTRGELIIDGGGGVRKATNSKLSIGAVWRLFSMMLTNCVGARHAHGPETFGVIFDPVSALLNNSCAPNAFAFFEGSELRVRSLKSISPGEEITICYLDPTTTVFKRQHTLKTVYFFRCRCSRCKDELKEEKELLSRDIAKINTLHIVQQEIIELMASAALAATNPGLHPEFEDPDAVQHKLLTLARQAFSGSEWWPDHLDPMPAARLCLGMLYTLKDRFPVALRNVLKAKLLSRRGIGPDWVIEAMEVVRVLILVGNLPPEAPEFSNPAFPSKWGIQNLVYGYLLEVCKHANVIFGGDTLFAKAIAAMYSTMALMADPSPGTVAFEKEFDDAQRKLLAWAGIDAAYGIQLSKN